MRPYFFYRSSRMYRAIPINNIMIPYITKASLFMPLSNLLYSIIFSFRCCRAVYYNFIYYSHMNLYINLNLFYTKIIL
nr:MAG TPA: hypothetical protein [Crassvirales sp.]